MSHRTAGALTRRAACLVYGTAGKGSNTAALTTQAITAGFRAIDTAAQPSTYAEDAAGEGIRNALKDTGLSRSDVWIQTKFTPLHDQHEGSAPYQPADSLEKQIRASIEQSLQHLQVDGRSHLDAVLLHSPYEDAASTLDAWQALCAHLPDQVSTVGVSNMSMEQLDELMQAADIKPMILQNRFTAETGYDLRLRAYCRDKDVSYQAYGTLTGNDHLLQSSVVQELARAIDSSPEGTLSALLVLGLNISVLNGTTNATRMEQALKSVDKVRAWREDNRNKWMNMLSAFKGSLSRGRVL